MTFDLAAYMQDAKNRIAEADRKAFASGLAFQQGPDVFAAHVQRTTQADLEQLYDELGYSSDESAGEAKRADSATGSTTGQAAQ
jgi:hypothetical protein